MTAERGKKFPLVMCLHSYDLKAANTLLPNHPPSTQTHKLGTSHPALLSVREEGKNLLSYIVYT